VDITPRDPKTARESPTLAIYSILSVMNAMSAVDPQPFSSFRSSSVSLKECFILSVGFCPMVSAYRSFFVEIFCAILCDTCTAVTVENCKIIFVFANSWTHTKYHYFVFHCWASANALSVSYGVSGARFRRADH